MTTRESKLAKANPGHARAKRPFTGAEYIESIQDGREVFLHGEKVKDVTTHPAFRNSVRRMARLYDSVYETRRQDVLTVPTLTRGGGFSHVFFRTPHSATDME